MKLSDMLKDIDVIETTADLNMELHGIAYDSRSAKEGDMFVAVTGFETDGHKYIPAAVKNGASVVMCQNIPETDVPYVRISDTRLGLAIAARNFFRDPAGEMKMIGITGTNGKTTSTTLLKHVLEETIGAKVGLIGTNVNMIGDVAIETSRTTPESYELQKLLREMADAGCTHVIMEVSSHSLVLDRVSGIKFAVGAFTNLTQDHLDFHKTMENYAEAKSLLWKQSAVAVINADDEWADFMISRAQCPVYTFSTLKNDADLTAKDIRFGASGVKFCAVDKEGIERIQLGIPGRFSVYNALTVIACAHELGIPVSQCAAALATAAGVKGRVEVVPTDGDYTIVIDYAHTPDALENVIRSMKEVTKGRVVVLFGCGGDRDHGKRPIMGAIAAKYADFVIITSDNPRTEKPEDIVSQIVEGIKGTRTPHKVIVDRPEAIKFAIDNHLPGDVIILAGKGHETYQEINHVKHHMDEREIVADILSKRNKAE